MILAHELLAIVVLDNRWPLVITIKEENWLRKRRCAFVDNCTAVICWFLSGNSPRAK